jgi:uncharacterized RDD family membrane protein YckC
VTPESSHEAQGAPSAHALDESSPRAPNLNFNNLLVSFRNRMACTVSDVLVLLFVLGLAGDFLRATVFPAETNLRPLLVGLVVLYFALSWSSRLAATPIQWVWGLRVVGYDGHPLSFGKALVRSALVTGLVAAAFTSFRVLEEPLMATVAAVAFLMLFLAAITPYKQAAPDLLARSLVVYRRELKKPDVQAVIGDLSNAGRLVRRAGFWLRVDDLILDVLTLGFPIVMLTVALPVHHTKNLSGRVAYAMTQTQPLKIAVEEYYAEYERLPADAATLGTGERRNYPDGGFYALETHGAIRIRFEVKPKLRDGSLRLTPEIVDERVVWTCRYEGDIEPRILPSSCRD